MVQARRQRHADLADDLRPHVERGVGLLPILERQRRPSLRRRAVGLSAATRSAHRAELNRYAAGRNCKSAVRAGANRRPRQRDAPHVILEVEARVLHPPGMVEVQWDVDHLLAERAREMAPALDVRMISLKRSVRPPGTVDGSRAIPRGQDRESAMDAIASTICGQAPRGKSCPMPSITTSRAPGTASAVSIPPSTGTSGSFLPWITSVGTRTERRRSLRSPSASTATICRATPLGS